MTETTVRKPRFSVGSRQLKSNLLALLSLLDEEPRPTLSELQCPDACAEIGSIADSVNANRGLVLEALVDVSTSILNTVEQLTSSSESVDSVLVVVTEQSQHASGIAAAAEQLSCTIASIAENVDNTTGASHAARDQADRGAALIRETVGNISEVNAKLTATVDPLKRLQAAADKADTIVAVVDDVAEQIQLLALNAGIEAARAGEFGRGFAVVANEVKNLSGMTHESISQIEEILGEVRKEVQQVSHFIEAGSVASSTAVKKVEETQGSFHDIATGIAAVDEEIATIATALGEQREAVKEISGKSSLMSSGADNVRALIEELAGTVDGIARSSNKTRMRLGSFDLGAAALVGQSKIDHLFWMHRLRRMVEGKETIQKEEFVDHTQCRLGKWYYSIDLGDWSAQFGEIHTKLGPIHEELHKLAAQAIAAHLDHDPGSARRLYGRCLELSRVIASTLDEIQTTI